ncbi:MAG: ADP-ribosylglycohydrolase family protein [Methanomicrobiales archaeon]
MMTSSRITGSLLGAAVGDALGMPGETGPARVSHLEAAYHRAWRGHPNHVLLAGQYTDDTQMMLISARLLADRSWTADRYATHLAALYDRDELRFPDGAVQAACDRVLTRGPEGVAICSETAGCIPPVIPFALACADDEMERRVEECVGVTHDHPTARVAGLTVARVIRALLQDEPRPIETAATRAAAEDEALGVRLSTALRLEREGMALEDALPLIGNDVTVTQTLPLALFLLSRYRDPYTVLALAAHIGGNSDTIGCICGACLGAAGGPEILPRDLVDGLEGREEIIALGGRLADLPSNRHKSEHRDSV